MPISQLLFSSEGRVRRSTYWFYSLVTGGISVLLMVIDLSIGTYSQDAGIGLLQGIFALIVLIPGILVVIKRAHDRDHSGWYILLLLIPIVNLVIGIELAFFAGTQGPNKYGPDPRGTAGYQPAPAAPAANTTSKLQDLKRMYEGGLISVQEYEAKRADLLAKM